MAPEDRRTRRAEQIVSQLPESAALEAATSAQPAIAVLASLDRRQRRRLLIGTIARIVGLSAVLLVVYFAVPLSRDTTLESLVIVVPGAVVLGAGLVYQVRRIITSPLPQLRAIESLATIVPLFIVLFSLVYVLMSQNDPANFSEPMTRVTALYFTVTVLATVGFGDVTAVTEVARIVVTVQMVLDLLLVGILVKVILGASRIGLQRRQAELVDEAQGGAAPPVDG